MTRGLVGWLSSASPSYVSEISPGQKTHCVPQWIWVTLKPVLSLVTSFALSVGCRMPQISLHNSYLNSPMN